MAAAVVDVESLFTDVGQVQKALERLDVHKDANEIYELLETHSFRTDRVQFVTSQLLYTLRVRNGLFEDDYNDEDHNCVDNHSVISISDDSSLDGMKDCDIKCENLLYSLSPEYEIPQMNDSEALDLTVPNDQNVSVSENSKEKEGEHSNATSHNDSFEPEVKNSNASPNYSLEPEDGTSKCLLNTYLRELDHFAVSVENVEKETEAAIATILDGFETGSGINMTDNDETKSQGAEESNYPAEQIDFLYDVNNNDPNNNTEYEVPLEEVERERGSKLTVEEPDESDLEFQDQDDIRAKLLAEAKLIHRIVPKQNLEQIYSYLEANLDNKSRLQIVMQEFLKMELLPETHAVPSESAQETNALYNEISYEGTDTSSGNAVPGLNSKPQPSTSKDYTKDSTLEIDPCASSNVMEPESELKLLPTAICDSVDSDSKMLNRDDVNHSTNTSLVLENSSDRLSELPGTSAVEQIPIKTSEQGVQIDDDYDEEIDILTIHVNDETSHNKKNAYNEIPIINTIGHMLPPPEQSQRNPRSLLKKRQKIANAKVIPKIAPAMICKNKNKGDRKKKIPHLNDAGAKAIPKIAPSMIFKNKNKGDKKKKIQSTFPCLNDARLCNLEKKTPLKNILPDDNKNKIKRVTFKLPADDRLIPDRKKNVKRMTFNIPADNIRPPDDRHLPDRKEKVKRVTFPVDNIRPLHVPLWDDDSGDDSDDDSDDSLLLSHKRYTQSNTAKKMKRLNEIFQKETVDDSDDDALLLGHKPYTQSNTDKFIENLTQMKDLTDRLERKRKSDDAVDSSPDKNRKIGETSINIPEPELNADQIRYKLTLLEMFPDADPNFLFEMCRKIFDEVAFDDLINRMLQKNYPVRDLPERMPAENLDDPQPGPSRSAKDKTEDIEAQYKILLAILPNADPSYLRQQCENLIGDENKMKAFVSDALENKVYPTKEEYIKRQEALALQKKYTEQFSVEAFLEIIPNPFKYFYEEKVNTEAGFNIVLPYLKSRYKRIRQSDICNELKRNNYSLARTCDRLDQFYGLSRKSKRGEYECRMLEEVNAPFLQEVAFIENKNKIRKFLEDKKRLKEKKFEEARALGDLMECGCCFDNEVLLEDIATCNDGHIFCKECIRKFAEVKIGDGATVFPCLSDCGSEFSLKTLQGLLKPSIFSRMLQRKQLEEVKAAGIEDLESCPFCDFASIPPRGDKIFKCLNPDCMRESCRLCKEPNHIPLRCEEVEKPAEVKARTYIEDRMTEALVRTCWKCSKKFIKEDGCNKMTCTCGAMMCYICRKPVKDYTHFNGEGGDAFHKCPLFSKITAVNVKPVLEEGKKLKEELKIKHPDLKLKYDPTEILKRRQKPKVPRKKCPLYSNNDVVNVNPVIEEAEKAKEEVRAMNPQINLKHDPTANLPEPAPPQAGRPRPPPIFDAGLILGPFLQQDFPFVNRQRQNYFNIPENQVHANNVRLDRRRHYLLERLRRAQDRARIRENNVFQFHRNDVPMAYQLGNNLAAQIENNIRVAAQHINELHMAERVVDNILAPAQGGNNIRMAAQIENNGRENNVRVAAQHVNDLRMAARVVDNVHVPAQGGNNIRMAAQIENNARENNVRVAAQHVNDVHMAAHVGDNVHVPAQGGNNIRMAAQIENNAPENNVRVAAQHANDVRMAAQVGNNVHVPAEGGNIRLAAQIENNVRVAAQHVNDVRMAAQGGNNVRLAAQDGNNVRMVAQGIVRVPEHHGNDDYIVRQHLHCVPGAFQLGNNVHLAARHESNVRVAAAQHVNDVRMAAQHGNNVRVERRNRIYVNPQHSNNVHLVGQQGNNVQVNDNYIFTAAQHENNGQVHRNNVRAAAQHGNNIQVNRNNLRMAVQVVAGPVNIQPARRYPDVLYANQYEPQRPGPYARYDPALAGEIVGVNRPLVQPVIVERRVQVPAQPLFNELPPAQPVIQEPADLLPPYAREP